MYQPQHDGLNSNESILVSSALTGGSFQQIFADTAAQGIDDSIYAEPLYLPNVVLTTSGCSPDCQEDVVFVATEGDTVYAFDADAAGNALWTTSLLTGGRTHVDEFTDTTCRNITPGTSGLQVNVGITGTPVIDISANSATGSTVTTGTLYVSAASKLCNAPCKGTLTYTYYQTLFALNITNGAIIAQTDISPTDSHGLVTWEPQYANQRGALLFENGNVYVPFASHCDANTWAGWLVSYQLTSGPALTEQATWLITPETVDTVNHSGIWGAGAGASADENGYIYAATSNGPYTVMANTGLDPTSCTPDTSLGYTYCNYVDSVVKLDSSLNVLDYFSPGDQTNRTTNDYDMGSGGAMIVPPQSSMGHSVALLVQGGKEGDLFLVNRVTRHMGGYSGIPYSDNVQQAIYGKAVLNSGNPANGLCYGYTSASDECGMYSSPAWWNEGNTSSPYNSLVFVGPEGNRATGANPGTIVQYTLHQSGILSSYQLVLATPTPVVTTDDPLAFPGTTPVISSASTTSSYAVLWYINNGTFKDTGGNAVFRAYDAALLGGSLWNSTGRSGADAAGPAIQFTVPTIANAHAYVGGYRQLLIRA